MSEEQVQHHIHCKTGDVGRYVLLPGSPERAEKISKHFDNAKLVAKHREHAVYTGEHKGIKVSVCSTGMGCPSATIAQEELGKIGADTFIRVGSAGGYQENIHTGDIVIYTAAYRADGTSKTYIPYNYPAVADLDVVNALKEASEELGIETNCGIGASGDAFYAEKPEGYTEMLHKANVLAGEMEASALFVVSSIRGWRTGCIVAVDGNIYLQEKKQEDKVELFEQAEEDEIKIALKAIEIMDKKN